MTKTTERHQASQALIDLRAALEVTQQGLAVNFLHCATTTVSRYESFGPPKGNMLLELRAIAKKEAMKATPDKKEKLEEIAERFQRLWLEEVYALLGPDAKSMLIMDPSVQRGMLVAFPQKFGMRAARDFCTLLGHAESDKPQYRDPATKLFKAMEKAAAVGRDAVALQIDDMFSGRNK